LSEIAEPSLIFHQRNIRKASERSNDDRRPTCRNCQEKVAAVDQKVGDDQQLTVHAATRSLSGDQECSSGEKTPEQRSSVAWTVPSVRKARELVRSSKTRFQFVRPCHEADSKSELPAKNILINQKRLLFRVRGFLTDEFHISGRKQFNEELDQLVERRRAFQALMAPEDRICTEGTANR
jgi:hypothetical protein